MAPEKETTPLHVTLMDGMTVKSRDDGSVHTIKGADGKTTVAEVCVGKKDTRLNFKSAIPEDAPEGIELSGHSTSWKGGGVRINDANLPAARELLQFVVDSVQPTAEETADDAESGGTGEEAAAASTRAKSPRSRSSRKAKEGAAA